MFNFPRIRALLIFKFFITMALLSTKLSLNTLAPADVTIPSTLILSFTKIGIP